MKSTPKVYHYLRKGMVIIMKADFEYIWTDKKRTIFGLPLSFTRYFLTEKKFITRKGFLNVVEDEFDLYRVNDKKLFLPFGQRVFGCGTVLVNVKDVDTPQKEVKSIKEPRKFMQLLDEQIEKQRDAYQIRGRDMIVGIDNDDCDCGDNDDA